MQNINLGQQHLVEYYDCCHEILNNKTAIREAMIAAARIAKATIVTDVFHEFNPHGISGVVVIAESHIAIHSWPEYRCASVDIFTCSKDMLPAAAISYLEKVFKAQKKSVKVIARGQINIMHTKEEESQV